MILAVKKTTVNIEVGLTSFSYQIKHKNIFYFLIKKIENLHKQIVNNTEPKRSFSIVVSDNQTGLKTWFKALDEKKVYEIALINLETYYSIQNIDRSNNCFSYSPGANTPWFDIINLEGRYHVEEVNEYIHGQV